MNAGRRWLLVALAALAAVWAFGPAGVPIYDGIGNPDEPYRYVAPPPDAKTTKEPTEARATLRNLQDGRNPSPAYANSEELGPQISLFVFPDALQAAAQATSIEVVAEPLAPAAPLPDEGRIVTNVYRISATADDGSPVEVVGPADNSIALQMRAPTQNQPGPVFEHRTPAGWVESKTIRSGYDVYQTHIGEFGEWALVQRSATADAGGNSHVGAIVLVSVILLLTAAIVVVRVRRAGNAAH